MSRRLRVDRLLASAPLFAALGDPTRLAIVAQLCEQGPQPTLRLTEGTGMSRQAVSKHLVALEEAGVVTSERIGRERIWELQPRELNRAQQHLEAIAAHWDEALGRLRAMVED